MAAPALPGVDPWPQPVVFFDGECTLCNGFVRWLLRHDRRQVLRFASLQGETARRLLPALPEDRGTWTVMLLEGQELWARSDAVLRICRRVGGWLGWLAWLRVVPRALRDAVYRAIAKRRYRWFGRERACPVPSPETASRFLP